MNCSPVVSVIIVNYNAGELLAECVASVHEHVCAPFEVIVFDNASSDDSLDLLLQQFGAAPWLHVIENCENIGFAVGNNLALERARGQIVHFLNPDATVSAGIDEAYRTALAGGPKSLTVTRLTDEKGIESRNLQAVPFFSIWLRSCLRLPIQKWALGASLIADRVSMLKENGWPEDYFMYAEDLDLCYTLQLRGWKIIESETRVMHRAKGVTQKVWTSAERQIRVERSGIRFAKKYNKLRDYAAFRWLALGRKFFISKPNAIAELRAYRAALREDHV